MTRMARSVAKHAMAAALQWSGGNALIASLARRREPLVLGYHSVVPDVRAHAGRAIPANLISVSMLERQLDWIGRRYRFVTLDELGAQVESGEPFSRPSAAVTFDDGYAGVYHHALPLLKRKGIPAGVFVVTELIDRAQLQVYDKLYLLLARVMPVLGYSESRFLALLDDQNVHLPEGGGPGPLHDIVGLMRHWFTTVPQEGLRRLIAALETVARIVDDEFPDLHAMTWDMVSDLDRSGMTIGSHTQTHTLLTIESRDRVVNQVSGSARTLERRLGKPVAHFAYPDGRFNPFVVSTVLRSGYRWAYTTCRHRDSRHPALTIPRILLWENACRGLFGGFSSNLMSCHASGVFNWMAPCEQRHDTDEGASRSFAGPAVESDGTRRRPFTFSRMS